MVEENYLPEQILNIDEIVLFWKQMPGKTFIHKEAKSMPGFKAFKNKITVLLGDNVTGNKLKPFGIWCSENPPAFKHMHKHALPMYYRSNQAMDDPAPLPRCPPELLCQQNGEMLFGEKHTF